MNRYQKKALYESIMQQVAKTVKNVLNEEMLDHEGSIIINTKKLGKCEARYTMWEGKVDIINLYKNGRKVCSLTALAPDSKNSYELYDPYEIYDDEWVTNPIYFGKVVDKLIELGK